MTFEWKKQFFNIYRRYVNHQEASIFQMSVASPPMKVVSSSLFRHNFRLIYIKKVPSITVHVPLQQHNFILLKGQTRLLTCHRFQEIQRIDYLLKMHLKNLILRWIIWTGKIIFDWQKQRHRYGGEDTNKRYEQPQIFSIKIKDFLFEYLS